MTETLLQFCLNAFSALGDTASGLLWPAVFFALLALILKRRALLGDLRRVVAETSLNLRIIGFNVIVMTPVFAMVAQGLADFYVSAGLVMLSPDAGIWAMVHPVLIIALAVFVGDFTGYWRHRLEHCRVLWPSHAVHHSDTEMTWLTLERFHPINRLTTLVIDSSVLIVLGFPPYAVIATYLVRHYYGFFIHAHIPWTYGWGAYVFVSPAMHRWHHAADPAYYKTNFATVFSIFDRAFGTYKVPGPCDAALGVSDAMDASLTGQLAYTFTARAFKR